MRKLIFELLVYNTDWQDVPFEELDRPRYLHLKQLVDRYEDKLVVYLYAKDTH